MRIKWFLQLLAPLIIIVSFAGCEKTYDLEEIGDEWGLDLRTGTIITAYDNRDGFPVDGTVFIEIEFTDDSCLDQITDQEGWKPLPMTDNISKFIYQPYCDDLPVPEIKNGYYYFYDRSDDAVDPYDDSELLNRLGFNFDFAAYDSDAGKLYLINLDT